MTMISTPGALSESNATASDMADCTARESSGAGVEDGTDDAGTGSVGSQPDL